MRLMLMRPTRLAPCGLLLLVSMFLHAGCRQDARKDRLAVTYIANEGFLIAMGDTKVLIDALPQSPYYRNPSDSIVARLMKDIPPFDNVDCVLVTHDHPDHFNAPMMARFLQDHRSARLIAGVATCSKLSEETIEAELTALDLKPGQSQTITNQKVEIVALPLVHTGNPDFPNLGFLVRANGRTILHVGDARLEYIEEYLRTVNWNSCAVDLLFIEYFDNGSGTREIIRKLIRPRFVVLMHIPDGKEANVADEAEARYPGSIVFRREGETREFDRSTRTGSSD